MKKITQRDLYDLKFDDIKTADDLRNFVNEQETIESLARSKKQIALFRYASSRIDNDINVIQRSTGKKFRTQYSSTVVIVSDNIDCYVTTSGIICNPYIYNGELHGDVCIKCIPISKMGKPKKIGSCYINIDDLEPETCDLESKPSINKIIE